MRFDDLAAVYAKLEATTKRLEMRAVLVDLLKSVHGDDLPLVLYLSQGLLRPEYEAIELGMAESLATKAVADVTGGDPAELTRARKASGDLGITVSERLAARSGGPEGAALELTEVYAELRKIAAASGEGSQETKVGLLAGLLRRATPREAKFLVRFVLGTLRLGVREMTILDALAQRYGDGTKEAKGRVEAAFNLSSDLGLVAETLDRGGLDALGSIHLEVGRPVRPMLAEREPTLAELLERMDGAAAFEYKYDGLRVQAHVAADGSVRLFSRRLEELSAQFPELVVALPKALTRTPAIVEGECVSIDPETDEIRPFQEISRRRGRKYDLEKIQSEIPVCLFLFDVLLDGTTATIDRPFPERRTALESLVTRTDRVRLATQEVVRSVDAAQAFFDRALSDGTEGIVAKSIADGSGYRAGARGFWWIKYKRDYTAGLADTVDGVVVGAFHGRGRRGGSYGALLLAVYNPELDRFESFCKVGSGFDDATLAEIPGRLKPYEVESRPASVETSLEPDRWITPKVVLEVEGAELTLSPIHRADFGAIRPGAGFALRFPRFTGKWRDDKEATDATTALELREMYQGQVRQVVADPGSGDDAPGAG